MALAAALALPALPALSASAANAAELQNVSFSNVTISEGSKPLDADGFLPASNTLTINQWNPGNVSGSAGNYVMLGFDVAVPNGAQPGDTFSVSLPEFWTVRGAASLADLVDPAGNTIATTKVVTVNGIRSIQFTLTEFVKDRENLAGNLTFMAQELSSPDRPVGDYVAPVVTNTGQELVELKARVPAPYWAAPSISMSWSGDPNTPTGGVELRSRPSYDGASSVKATVYAGPGYIFDCEALRNQDPTKAIGIGLVDIGPEGVRNSLPTEEWLLDPSKYTLTCDGGSFTVEMPASSWTSADAESGQVLRIITTRIPTDDSWKDDGAVFAYADLEQNGRTLELNGRAVPPGSTGSGTSNQLPPRRLRDPHVPRHERQQPLR
ncbi:Ig-like domain-containing protein [Leucobacter luti]|uniref:Ig-like domain-containing protein n=1 Tax=Leucobacter luti TaxID=340320 RepID=UPI003D04C37C